jgi:transposase
MIQVAPGTKVHLACRPVSMRYGFDGLSAKVASVLALDPYSGLCSSSAANAATI